MIRMFIDVDYITRIAMVQLDNIRLRAWHLVGRIEHFLCGHNSRKWGDAELKLYDMRIELYRRIYDEIRTREIYDIVTNCYETRKMIEKLVELDCR